MGPARKETAAPGRIRQGSIPNRRCGLGAARRWTGRAGAAEEDQGDAELDRGWPAVEVGLSVLFTDVDAYCMAVTASRVEDGSLPPGDVLLADIRHLGAAHLQGYRQVHLFCGIAGMALGLAWSGFPDDQTILTGGFPCQDISVAGKGAGLSGERSGLFWEIIRVLKFYPASVCILENVGALSRRGLDVVAGALGEAGYVVPEAYRLGAWALGAPHERERWWIVGYRRTEPDPHPSKEHQPQAGRRRDTAGSAAPTVQEIFAYADSDVRGAVGERGPGREPHEPSEVQPEPVLKPGSQSPGHALQRGWPDDAQHAGMGDARRGVQPHTNGNQQQPAGARPGSGGGARQAGDDVAGRGGVFSDAGGRGGGFDKPEWRSKRGAASGWADPVAGPWRRVKDEWQYAGAPVFVYRSGEGSPLGDCRRVGKKRAAAQRAGGVRSGDPTIGRGWPVPVLPGHTQREWEKDRLHQRSVGGAIHGVSGRMADTFNKCGVMALGNSVVPEIVAAVARGIQAGLASGHPIPPGAR